MEQYLSSVSLKTLAKGQLLGKYGTVVLVTVLQILCTAPISIIISSVIMGANGIFKIFVFCIAVFLLGLFVGYFTAGQAVIYLKIACNQLPQVSDLFYFFRGDASKLIYIQAILTGISTLCTLPSLIVGHYVNLSIAALTPDALLADTLPINASLLLLYVVLYVAGTVIDIYICSLLFSQVFYLMLDFPDYSGSQLLKMSIQLMKGSKGRLFYLILSFIPMLLLGVFSCGIALLWVTPYMQTTYANFYLDLIRKKPQKTC